MTEVKKVIMCAGNCLTPLGFTTEENFRAVAAGATGVRRHEGTFGLPEPFAASLFDRAAIARQAAAVIPGPAAVIPGSDRGSNLFETLLILSIQDAVQRAGIDPASPRVAFVISSIKGNVEVIGEDESSVPVSVSAVRVASFFGNPNEPLVVSNACISGLTALIHARRMLLDGRYDHVVVAGAEVQSRFIISGFQCLKAVSPDPCKPFDAARCGLNPGEAAATMVVSAVDRVPEDAWELVDGATRNDANHISGPSRTGEGSYKTLRYVLAHCSTDELAFVNVHGTSTLYNDEMESIALQRAGLLDVPVNALKGAYGHTMGAAGILESLLSMQAVDAGVVLATRGFETLGVSYPVNVSNQNRTTGKQAFIKLLSGFGGCNAAMLFRKGGAR